MSKFSVTSVVLALPFARVITSFEAVAASDSEPSKLEPVSITFDMSYADGKLTSSWPSPGHGALSHKCTVVGPTAPALLLLACQKLACTLPGIRWRICTETSREVWAGDVTRRSADLWLIE